MTEHPSILSVHLWDMRAAVEAQLRCLTAVQRSIDGFKGLSLIEVRDSERAKVLKALYDISDLSRAVDVAVTAAIEQAEFELTDA